MGPQLDSCGRTDESGGKENTSTLQWGRNLIVAEGPLPDRALGLLSFTSMGPQLDSCGRGRVARGFFAVVGTSMGPQLDSCGRTLAYVVTLELATLQWGRNLIVAEGRRRGRPTKEANATSMGPQLDSCGRGPDHHSDPSPDQKLQWGRNLIVAEGTASTATAARTTSNFNGAAT